MFGRTITPKRRCSASKLVRCIPDCFSSRAAEASFHDKRLQIVAACPTDLPVFDMFTGDRAKQIERESSDRKRQRQSSVHDERVLRFSLWHVCGNLSSSEEAADLHVWPARL